MFATAIDGVVTNVATITDFPTGSVERGEVGKISTVKNAACLVMPDFGKPASLTGDTGELSKQIPFHANCFVIAAGKKTLKLCENAVMDLAFKVIDKVGTTEALISMNGNQKYCYWELTGFEWEDRSASLCVIALEFTINLQL